MVSGKVIDDLAQAERYAVGETYISCFAMLGDPAKGRSRASRFYAEHER